MKKEAKWKKDYAKLISEMSNKELFEEYLFVYTGDGEDGYSSDANDWKIKEVRNLLERKFIECGFFKSE